jgi:hypothetical protein
VGFLSDVIGGVESALWEGYPASTLAQAGGHVVLVKQCFLCSFGVFNRATSHLLFTIKGISSKEQ